MAAASRTTVSLATESPSTHLVNTPRQAWGSSRRIAGSDGGFPMKLLTAALAGAALIAAPMIIVSPASAQAVMSTTTTATAHTYHYGYVHHRRAAYRAPCSGHYGYATCDSVYLSGVSPETGQAVDMDYQAPIGTPIYANGDVTIDCSCTHHH
jgi:hypothetical protein